MGNLVTKNAEFTAWVIQAMDGWPGPKDQKRLVIEMLYDAYRQGRIHGMDSVINPLRQAVQNFDNMVANGGKFNAKLVKTVKEVLDAKSNTGP